jgi:hypothetical protein
LDPKAYPEKRKNIKNMGKLIGMEIVSEFVQAVLMTGKVRHFDPVSALLIGTPECGKTSLVTDVYTNTKGKTPCAIQLTDVTGRGLMELCKNHPEITHFILNDMVAILSHKQSVNTYTLSILNAMTEEGIQAAAYPGKVESYTDGKRAIIGCITTTMMADQRRWWNAHGLASRLFPFCFDHDAMLTIKIKDSIENANEKKLSQKKKKRVQPVPLKKIQVTISASLRNEVRKISDTVAKTLGDHKGYRRLHQFNSLVRGHALASRRHIVNKKDIDFLNRIMPYVSYVVAHPL